MQQQRKWAGSDAQAHPWLQIEFEASLRAYNFVSKEEEEKEESGSQRFIPHPEQGRSGKHNIGGHGHKVPGIIEHVSYLQSYEKVGVSGMVHMWG